MAGEYEHQRAHDNGGLLPLADLCAIPQKAQAAHIQPKYADEGIQRLQIFICGKQAQQGKGLPVQVVSRRHAKAHGKVPLGEGQRAVLHQILEHAQQIPLGVQDHGILLAQAVYAPDEGLSVGQEGKDKSHSGHQKAPGIERRQFNAPAVPLIEGAAAQPVCRRPLLRRFLLQPLRAVQNGIRQQIHPLSGGKQQPAKAQQAGKHSALDRDLAPHGEGHEQHRHGEPEIAGLPALAVCRNKGQLPLRHQTVQSKQQHGRRQIKHQPVDRAQTDTGNAADTIISLVAVNQPPKGGPLGAVQQAHTRPAGENKEREDLIADQCAALFQPGQIQLPAQHKKGQVSHNAGKTQLVSRMLCSAEGKSQRHRQRQQPTLHPLLAADCPGQQQKDAAHQEKPRCAAGGEGVEGRSSPQQGLHPEQQDLLGIAQEDHAGTGGNQLFPLVRLPLCLLPQQDEQPRKGNHRGKSIACHSDIIAAVTVQHPEYRRDRKEQPAQIIPLLPRQLLR